MHVENPLLEIIGQQGYVVLDGGLATTLEARGYDLDDDLWSARFLLEDRDAIRQVHRDFLDAGADCIVTASYQASLEGFARRGVDAAEGEALIRSSVDLAMKARQNFLDESGNSMTRPRPLVAASVGPYGAFLADGSEYTGQYDIDDAGLLEFHRERWRILAGTPADLLACETIPSLRETSVLLSLLADTPERWAWFSFSCRDGLHLNDGSPIADAVRMCADAPRVAAVGVNCTAPRFVPSLIAEARRVSDLLLLVYPNSGEKYDATTKTWANAPRDPGWENSVSSWYAAGARGIGGCCRIGPGEIARARRVLVANQGVKNSED